MSSCTYTQISKITSIPQICTFISKNCPQDYINFYYLHYCTFESHYYYTVPIFTIILIILFYLLSDTSNNFLGTALTKIVEKLKINQNIAGVTILAFGNGASDVISSLVVSNEIDGLEFAIGSLIGGGIFITSFIISLIIFYGNNLTVNPEFFNRDILLYIISVIYLVLICIYGKINLIVSSGFIVIYIIYVVFAIYQDRKKNYIENKFLNENESFSKIDNDIKNLNINLNNAIELTSGTPKDKNIEENKKETEDNIINIKEDKHEVSISDISTNNSTLLSKSSNDSLIAQQIVGEIKDEINIKEQIMNQVKEELINNRDKTVSKLLEDNMQQLKIKVKKYYYNYKETSWDDDALYWKCYYILLDFPFTLLRELTIPIYEDKKWNKIKFCLNPLCSFIFIIYALKLFDFFIHNIFLLLLTLTILSLLSIFIYYQIDENTPIKYESILITLTFTMSLFWLWFIANILISILQAIGLILNIPETFLAMTLLTYGNCITDLFLNISLVKGGYGEMALAGSIGGPLFNLLVGLGASLFKINFNLGSFEIHMFNYNNFISVFAIFVLFVNLIRLFIQSHFNNYVLGKNIAYVGFFIYAAFFFVVVIFTFF